LRESEAAAADVFCAKAKRQRQMFFARKRSGSGRCSLRESEAAAADVLCAKAKRQRQDVGHSVVAIGRGVLRLSSSISVDAWTPAHLTIFCICRFAFATKTLAERS